MVIPEKVERPFAPGGPMLQCGCDDDGLKKVGIFPHITLAAELRPLMTIDFSENVGPFRTSLTGEFLPRDQFEEPIATTAGDHVMTTNTAIGKEVEARRKAFIRKVASKMRGVAQALSRRAIGSSPSPGYRLSDGTALVTSPNCK
jgi:hypothetical protein